MSARAFGIHAVATDLPRARMTAAELTATFAYEPGVIEDKLGLREKCVARDDDEHPSDFGVRATRRALAALGARGTDVGLVVFTGASRDYLPSYSVALAIVEQLGMPDAIAYDLVLGCAAPLVAMDHARRRDDDGRPPLSIVVAAERWSDTLSPRVPFPLAWTAHADGGAAVVVGPDAPLVLSQVAVHMRPDFNHFLVVPAGGTREPASAETLAQERHARRIFRKPPVDVVDAYVEGYRIAVGHALSHAGRSLDDVELLLMNQIRPEMRAQVRAALGMPAASELDHYAWLGHLGGADSLTALEIAARRQRVPAKGSLVLAASSVTAFAAVHVDVRGVLRVPEGDASGLPARLVMPAPEPS